MVPWFMWVFLALPLIILGVGLPLVHFGYFDKKLKKKKVYQSDFALMLDTPAKKARHLKEQHEWDREFYGTIQANDPSQLIIYNGKLVTISQADRLYFLEEQKRKYY
jgi:hypothetical protein